MSRLVARDIAVALKQRITAGEWMESGQMPSERYLANEFGVARNTLRRAINLLKEEGMLSPRVGSGTFILGAQGGTLAATITRMEGTSPADMMEIRLLLEPSAAYSAAATASTSELDALQEAHDAAIAATDMPTFEQWDAEFHHRIFACSRNEFLKDIHNVMRILRNQSPWFEMKKRSFSDERRLVYCAEHQKILEALLRRDPGAARDAMLAHLQTVSRNLLGR